MEAQKKKKQTEIWNSFHLKNDWSKRWSSDLRLEARVDATTSTIGSAIVDLENSLKVTKWLSGEVYYRITHEFDDDARHRVALQLSGKPKWKKWSIQPRVRWEWKIEDEDLEERFRLRIKPKYDAGANEFEVFGELFYNEEAELRQKRWGAGWAIKVAKRKTFKLRMMLDDGLRRNDFILRLEYHYKLK